MIVKTFACFMFLFGIFLPFFQSHSSLCSFKKYKNLLKEKIHKSFKKQFIEIPYTTKKYFLLPISWEIFKKSNV